MRTKFPAYGKICRRCQKPNHFHTVCLKGRQTKTIATMEETEVSTSSESDELVYAMEHIGTVRHTEKGKYFVSLNFQLKGQDTMIECQLDTGATCNVICLKDVCTILQTDTVRNNTLEMLRQLHHHHNRTVYPTMPIREQVAQIVV